MKLCKNNEWKVLIRELKLIKEYQKSYLYLLMVCKILCGAMVPVCLAYNPKIFISWLNEGQELNIINVCALFGTIFILSILNTITNKVLDVHLTKLRRDEVERYQKWYQKIDYVHLEDPTFAVKSESALDALGGGEGFFAVYMNFMSLGENVITAIVSSVVLFESNPLIIVVCVLILLAKSKIDYKITDYIKENEPERAKLNRQKNYYANVGYDFSYGKDIRIFMLSKKLKRFFCEKSEEYIQNVRHLSLKKLKLNISTEGLLLVRNAIVFFLIGIEYYNGSIDISDVTLLLGMTMTLNSALDTLSDTWTEFVSNTTYASHYFDLLDAPFYMEDIKDAEELQEKIHTISFENVCFKYPKTDAWILQNLNLEIQKGEKIAFVGVNGAGKSTIIKLLTHLYDVTSGAIKVNGINVNSITKEEYYKRFSVVYQDVNVYAGSILENIAGTSEKEIDRERAIECIKAMKLDAKIATLPQGYDTTLLKVIDESGTEFSGGQNQKLAIARALYKNADVYILDEPTSALDALAEKEVFELFNEAVKDKTVIYISHRLSSTKFCDRIYMLTKEGICEYGTHEELMQKKGEYYQMFETQGKYYRKEVTGNGVSENIMEVCCNHS